MANGGRSKYLGPNASSEWLRDVSPSQPELMAARDARG